MNFLNSITTLGLAVASAATMIATQIAPTVAQTPQTRTITFFNQGGYTARYFITAPGIKTFDSQTMLLGQKKTVTVPAFTNVTVTGRREDNRQVIFQRSFRVDNSVCFKTFGTIFNPQVNNSCN
ncbi:hypothetical protein [Chamaesiphon sp. VAR_48_metabat_135_sub]|uniref:hypothetical protein n=1 Tax=Chamaesiphon sp. VAR_48_metabat_135_sub TaxID=2964699 RepID=UPI00286C8559|nr:hypothetical protein [Chamaesiphon sp. VAR_48_metabat_135_sub]